MDLPPEHTAILFHWAMEPGKPIQDDRLFVHPGIITGEPLHQLLDPLIDEHCIPTHSTTLVTEVILYWHFADGTWSYDDYISTMACA